MSAPSVARALALGCAVLLGGAARAQDVRQERSDIHRRLQERKAELEALRSQKVSVLELLELSQKMADASSRRAKLLEVELKGVQRRAALAKEQEALARQEVEARLSELSPRLLAMYRLRRRAPLDVLLTARDFAALIWRSRAMRTLLSRDLSLLSDARRAVGYQRRALRQADFLQQWMGSRLEALRAETAEAETRRAEFSDLLSFVRAEASQSSRVIKELERAERQLSTLIEQLETTATSGFGALRGKLPLPTHGVIEVGFGKVVNPRFNTVTVQKGVDIRAVQGMPVRAVAGGKVAFAGWLRGYGNLVIVDHGDGFHTLVAHLADISCAVGDPILGGDDLGTVGDTGSLKGAYLYFEIRQRGLAVDPALWIAPGLK